MNDIQQRTVKAIKGNVISVKDKTVSVLVITKKRHPLYEKFIQKKQKFHAHNPDNVVFNIGDDAYVRPYKKISKTKSYIIVTDIKKKN